MFKLSNLAATLTGSPLLHIVQKEKIALKMAGKSTGVNMPSIDITFWTNFSKLCTTCL
jgi:hypothetical protein